MAGVLLSLKCFENAQKDEKQVLNKNDKIVPLQIDLLKIKENRFMPGFLSGLTYKI